MANKRNIPQDIKRKLRQESNFGCCKHGNPIIEYHHIIPWHQTEAHNEKDMMVLCPTCHHSIDSYSEENQKKIKNNPYNKSNINNNGTLIVSQGICAINTGAITLFGDGPIITSNKKSYLEFYVNNDNILELTLTLFNQIKKNILKIKKNEWIKGDISYWDIEFTSGSRKLKIKEKEGETNIEIDASKFPLLVKGKFWIGKHLLEFNSKRIFLNNHQSLNV